MVQCEGSVSLDQASMHEHTQTMSGRRSPSPPAANLALLTSLCTWLLLVPSAIAQGDESWSEAYPAPTSQALVDVESDGTNFVAVGGAGTVVISPDGTNWATAVTGLVPAARSLRAVIHQGERWVAVGDSGTIVTSDDGVKWTTCTRVTTEHFNDVCHGGGRFVAVGSYGAVASSTNGFDWKMETNPNPWASSLYSIVYAKGLFLAGGLSGVQTSHDGVEWVPQQLPDNHDVFSVWFDGEQFIAGRYSGLVLTSGDATNWVPRAWISAPYIQKLTKMGNMWLAAAGELWHSPDLTNWAIVNTRAYASTSAGGINSAQVAADKLVVVGEAGNVLVSEDGTNFLQCRQGQPFSVGAAVVCHNGRRIVATAASIVLTSDDLGASWSEWAFGPGGFSPLAAIADESQVVVAGTYVSTFGYGANEIRTSPDGIQWASRRLNSHGGLLGVARTSDGYMAVGAGGIVHRSTTGETWSSFVIPGKPRLTGVVSGPEICVAVGPANTIYVSSGADEWKQVPSGTANQLVSVAYGNGRFVAVGQRGAVVWSDNGSTWTGASAGAASDFRRIVYRNTQFIALGSGITMTSPDGITWTNLAGAPPNLRGLDWDEEGFIATAERSIIRSGSPFVKLAWQGAAREGLLQLHLLSRPGATVQLQSSPDLTQWRDSLRVTNLFGSTWLELTPAKSSEFYRARHEDSK